MGCFLIELVVGKNVREQDAYSHVAKIGLVNAPPPKGGGFGVTDSSPDSGRSSAEVFRPEAG
jgi:hypothetical protein